MADHKMDTSFLEEVKKEAADAVIELLTQAKLEEGDILVVGCSSSEVVGERIGTFSSVETAEAVFDGIYEVTKQKAICLALPTDHTELNCKPLVTALSRINTAVAPELEIKSTPCGFKLGIGWLNTL